MKKFNIFLTALLATALASCSETEPTYETRPADCAAPTLSIEGQEELFANGTSAMVESDVTFRMHAAAEAGLTELLINDRSVRNFTYGQLRENFDFKFTMPDVADTTLVFTVCDEEGQSTSLSPITITAEGRIASDFLIADMQGELVETAEVPLPMHEIASKTQEKITVRSDIEGNGYAYLRRLWEATYKQPFAFAQADPAGGEEKCLKITKEGPALNMQIRLDQTIPSTLIDGVLSGERKLVMDIYIDSNEVPASNNNIMVFYANFARYKNDASGMVHNCVSQWIFTEENLHTWTEAVFDLGSSNTGTSNHITTSEVDMLVMKPTMNNSHGPYYIKNIRIVKADEL